MSEVARAALDYIGAGFMPVPLLPKSKHPGRDGWQNLRVSSADVPALFPPDANIGLLLGHDLVDCDLDCPEAVALAPSFLPATSFKSGRASNPLSHYWFRGNPVPEHKKFEFDGECLVELRSVGQTVAPPSIHDSTGEQIIWHEASGTPPTIAGNALARAVAELAAATLLARHYPKQGSRHDFSLALSGFLLRRGWPLEKTCNFMQAVSLAAGDEEVEDRVTAVETTAERLDEGAENTGGGKLRELIGSAVFSTFCEWLGFSVPATFAQPIEADAISEDAIPAWPAVALDGDYISELTFLLTTGTSVPPGYIREEIVLVLAALADGQLGYPHHPDLPLRRYLALLSERPQSCKGESWKRIAGITPEGGCLLPLIRETVCGDGAQELRILNGTSIGSGQYLAKELEEAPRAVITWDELDQLLNVSSQQCSTLFSALKSLFESNSHWSGSFTNKKHGGDNLRLSVLMQGTRPTFETGFLTKRAAGDGLLSRFVLAYSERMPVVPEWEPRDLHKEREVIRRIRGMIPRAHTVPMVADDARERMKEYVLALNDPKQADVTHTPRLFELIKVDLLHRCVYSGAREITLEMVERSLAWGNHQLALRRALWPTDAKTEVAAMTQVLLRRLRKGNATANDLRRAAHTDRDGSHETFNRCLTALTRSGQVKQLGKNRKQRPVYGLDDEGEKQ